MLRFRKFLLLAACAPTLWSSARAVTVRVENPTGSVTVRAVAGREVQLKSTSPRRDVVKDDTRATKQPGLLVVECKPADGAPIDLEVGLPYGAAAQVRTASGKISLLGLIRRAEFITDTGDIELAAPWRAMRLLVEADREPEDFVSSSDIKFSETKFRADGKHKSWRLTDWHAELKITYGRIQGKAGSPDRVTVRDLPFPGDAPVRLPWQAPEVLEAILHAPALKPRPSDQPPPAPQDPANAAEEGAVVFTSEVRIVNLVVAVYDQEGHPLPGLKPDNFEVLEDGVPQEVMHAGSEDAPINLALLLDLSGSTKQDRDKMKEAARNFLEIARPHDRVAAYALANDMFHVISSLTEDRKQLQAVIEAIPEVSGGSPLYDAIVFSYAQELHDRAGERNALIVISDGVDNQLYGIGTPSKVSFRKLERAAGEMNALIYPIFLDPAGRMERQPKWGKRALERLERLAAASGGRVFPARSIEDLAPVYPQVAEELRSVYSVAYYPKNQNFDGAWRAVEVKVKRPGAKVRSRAGYYAR